MKISKAAIIDFHACMHECIGILLDHIGELPPDLLTRELDGFGRLTVRDQIAHVLSTERGWVRGLQLLPWQRLDPATLTTVALLREAQQEVVVGTAAYLQSLTEYRLNAELERYPEDWVGPARTPAFILLHVITHAFHHKGQIVAMLRLLGYPAPDTDMQRT